jgi:hypothetical protein
MGCPRGGSHNWRPVDRSYKGTILDQCTKCGQYKENISLPGILAIGVVVVIILILILHFFGYFESLRTKENNVPAQVESSQHRPTLDVPSVQALSGH